MLTTRSPSPVIPATVTVYVGPVPLTLARSVPPIVLPVKDTSAAVNPITGSANTTANAIGPTFTGSAWLALWLIVTVGLTLSNRTELSVLVDARLPEPNASVADPTGIDATISPSPSMPVTETV